MTSQLGVTFSSLETCKKIPKKIKKDVFYIVGPCKARFTSVNENYFIVNYIEILKP